MLDKGKKRLAWEEEDGAEWEKMSPEALDAYFEHMESAAQSLSSAVARKILVSRTKARNSEKARERCKQDARNRICIAVKNLKSREERLSIAAIAREGKLNRSTVRRHDDLVP
jgi:hypothetical protein